MWAWGCVKRVAAGLLGGPLAGGGRWNTAVAVGVTAAAGLVLVAVVVSSRRGGLKSPWRRRRRKAPLSAQEWRYLFTPEGKLQDGGVKLLKKVRSRGIEPSIRAQVWPFLLGVYSLDSSEAQRDVVKAQNTYNLQHKYKAMVYSTAMKVPVSAIELYLDIRSTIEDHVRGFTEPTSDKLLPDLLPQDQHVFTLVLDLNETLVYSDWQAHYPCHTGKRS